MNSLPWKVHRLAPGDVLLFDSEIVHAGAGYDRDNYRLHCYLHSCAQAAQATRASVYTPAWLTAVLEVHESRTPPATRANGTKRKAE